MQPPKTNRRTFVLGSAAAAAATGLGAVPFVHAAGSDTLKVGLIGCGGRGTGAAEQALTADSNTKLHAMADAFRDRLEESLSQLRSAKIASQLDVPEERRFVGFDAYKQVVDCCDVVLLTTPPGFRPQHLAYAVEKGRHLFVEKPVAVDAPGVRSVLESAAKAKAKGLALVSGLCWRYYEPRREAMKRVHDGAIGDVVAVETTYDSKGVWDPRRSREECKSDMEYQMRNWYYYAWLSGDHIVEQAVHGIDTMAWALGDEPPTSCFGVGGRQARVDPKYGNIYDHFSIVYEYPNGVRGYHQCRHWPNTEQRVKDFILGAKGQCDVFAPRITGETKWRFAGATGKFNMYQAEHDALFKAIRAGEPKSDALYAARSTLLAIMGREAAYTGSFVTWDMAMNSQDELVPKQLAFDAPPPQRGVPTPGVTKFA